MTADYSKCKTVSGLKSQISKARTWRELQDYVWYAWKNLYFSTKVADSIEDSWGEKSLKETKKQVLKAIAVGKP